MWERSIKNNNNSEHRKCCDQIISQIHFFHESGCYKGCLEALIGLLQDIRNNGCKIGIVGPAVFNSSLS